MPGVAPEPVPRPKPNTETQRYMKYEETSGYDRTIDDFQPRKKCKEEFANSKLNTAEDIKKFSRDYIVEERLVREYVSHLQNLKLKIDKRKEETIRRNERSAAVEDDQQKQRKG